MRRRVCKESERFAWRAKGGTRAGVFRTETGLRVDGNAREEFTGTFRGRERRNQRVAQRRRAEHLLPSERGV